MTSSRIMLSVLAGAVGFLVLTIPVSVLADGCRNACTAVKTTAGLEGKTALKSCKLGCRTAANVRECRRNCQSALKQGRDTAVSAFATCRQSCQPSNACEQQCLGPAQQCLAPILDQARTCGRDCESATRAAAQACLHDPDPFQCAADVANQLVVCAQGCGMSASASVEGCKSAFESCKASCAPPSSPPPPCEQQCAGPLQTCLGPVAQQARECTDACTATAHDAAAACRTAADPAACLAQVAQQLAVCTQGCATTAGQSAQACRTAFDQCIQACRPPDPCRDPCLATAGTCLDAIPPEATACANNCIASAQQSAAACIGQSNQDACLAQVAQQLAQCMHGCGVAARAAADSCRAAAASCLQDCQQPPPTPGPGSCRDACLGSAEGCLGSVLNGAKSCGEQCAAVAYQGVPACLSQPDPIGCLNGLAQQADQCAQDCKATADAAVQTCRSTLDSCVQACPPDPCRDGCIGALESCVAPVVSGAETCGSGCMTAAYQAGVACLLQPNPMACLSEVAQQFEQCGHGCEAATAAGVEACKGGFLSCQQSCGS